MCTHTFYLFFSSLFYTFSFSSFFIHPMPFRCKCGKTFEKADTFATHTSGCALFHHRRMSESSALLLNRGMQSTTSPISIPESQQQQQPSSSSSPPSQHPLATSTPNSAGPISSEQNNRASFSSVGSGYFMPTGLSLHYAFEDAVRKRSMSYGDTNHTTTTGDGPSSPVEWYDITLFSMFGDHTCSSSNSCLERRIWSIHILSITCTSDLFYCVVT